MRDGFSSIMNSGLSSRDMQSSEEKMMDEAYKNVYGKTLKELCKEGKSLMKENDITIEGIKEKVQDANLLQTN